MFKFTFIATMILSSSFVFAERPLNEKIENLNKITVSEKEIKEAIESNEFEYIHALHSNILLQNETLNQFKDFINTRDTQKKLNNDEQLIVTHAYDVLKSSTHKIYPPQKNYKPDGLIVLGAKNGLGILESRLDIAYTLSLLDPEIPIIVSGKGRDKTFIEAKYMSDYLIKKGVDAKRIYMENESLDTVGNAIFSQFLISKTPQLKDKKDWLVITNNYHAMRSGYIFKNVFSTDYHVSLYYAPLLPEGQKNENEDVIFKRLVTDEIKSKSTAQFTDLLKIKEYNQKKDKFINSMVSNETCSIFINMLSKHGLYKEEKKYYIDKYPHCIDSK